MGFYHQIREFAFKTGGFHDVVVDPVVIAAAWFAEQDAVVVSGRVPDHDSSQILPVVDKLDRALDSVRKAHPGYEIAVTPMQMVRAFSTFAREGDLAGTIPSLRLTAADPQLIQISGYTPDLAAIQFGCGIKAIEYPVVFIYTPKPDGKARTDGEINSLEFVPKDFTLEP